MNDLTVLHDEFDEAVDWLADKYSLDIEDLKVAYEEKPESLVSHFNAASAANSRRNRLIGWSVFWLIVFPPVAIYTGIVAYMEHQKVDKVSKRLENHVRKFAQLPAPKT